MRPRPNLLILLACGLRSDALGDKRAWPLATPCLERLAERGLRLVAVSACPTHQGGLVSLLTGLHPRQHGHVEDTNQLSVPNGLPSWLTDAGYRVAAVGCVGLMGSMLADSVIAQDVSVLNPSGCHYWQAVRSKGLAPALMQQRKQRLRCGPFEPTRLLLEPADDVDGFIEAEALKMLDRLPADKPWALFVVFSGPGNDLPPPTLYQSLVEPEQLQQGFTPADLTRLDALAEPAYPRVLLQRLEPQSLGRIRADYLGRVSLIDHGIGQVVDAANNRPDRNHTWTVVASDRGHLLGEHGLIGRRSFLAGAVEVPVIIAAPLRGPRPTSQHDDGLISTVDVAATIGALSGADLPPGVAGRSLLPVFSGNSVLPSLPGGALSEFNDRLMLETERFKIVFERTRRRCLGLFDLLNDPDEKHNLVDSAMGRNVVDSLRWRLADALLPLRAAAW